MESRDVSFIPKEYQEYVRELTDEQYTELLFEWASLMPGLCGNGAPGGNFWMANQRDDCMKILEDGR